MRPRDAPRVPRLPAVGRRRNLVPRREPLQGRLRVRLVAVARNRADGDASSQGEGFASALTAHLEGAFPQLQVFSAPKDGRWDRARGALMAKIASRGGEVREITGQLGTEIRGAVPGGESGGEPVAVRFVGCAGPGWMLRGVMTGPGADSGLTQEHMRRAFLRPVADIRDATPLPTGLIRSRWPHRAGGTTPTRRCATELDSSGDLGSVGAGFRGSATTSIGWAASGRVAREPRPPSSSPERRTRPVICAVVAVRRHGTDGG
ncbi:DUF3710 domain-containing protein [Streptomyces actuosus]|uniref:DUF3710 domain-containing protein n=1 Tax=Streptomyces actuosus TaxID=1885 RepID=A0ABS2VUK6_STRAS|nr:DUF3710 domain-containing protein [Streptomyces actuosus]